MRTLWLHTAYDGNVWYGIDGGLPRDAGRDSADFAETFDFAEIATVRVLGSSDNSRLLTELYRLQRYSRLAIPVQLGTPLVCREAGEAADPRHVIPLMRSLRLAPSQGGWHTMTPGDAASYMICAARQQSGEIPPAVQEALTCHPAWPALSFVPTLCRRSACEVIADILDPRWFVNPMRPHRTGRLTSFMGISTQTLQSVILADNGTLRLASEDQSSRTGRGRSVLGCWASNVPQNELSLDDAPRQFLWRMFLSSQRPAPVAAVQCCRKFLMLLRGVWLDGLRTGGDRLFDPETFFRFREESESYILHVRRMTTTRD